MINNLLCLSPSADNLAILECKVVSLSQAAAQSVSDNLAILECKDENIVLTCVSGILII